MANNNQSVWGQSISLKEQASILWWLIKTAKPVRLLFFLTVIFTIAQTYVTTYITHMLSGFMNTKLTDVNTTMSTIISFAVVFAIYRLLYALFVALTTYIGEIAAYNALSSVRVTIFKKLHGLGMRFFDQVPAGSLVTRVMNDTDTFYDFWFFIYRLFSAVALIVGAYIGMFLANAQAAAWMLVILPIMIAIFVIYQKFATSVFKNMRSKLSALNAMIAESISGISVIQDFEQSRRFADKFGDINKDYFNARFAMIKADASMDVARDLLYGVTIVAALASLGWLTPDRALAGGMVYAFVTYIGNIFEPLHQLTNSMSTLQEATVSGYRVRNLLAEDTYEPEQNAGASGVITRGKIEFRNVNFSYDGVTPILKNISFVAEPGQTVAFVGHTGSGKSSTINALMRYYDFDSGDILIDDQPIRDIAPASLRQQIGLVLQDPFMFYGDVAFNIRMYDGDLTDDDVTRAAQLVGADKFIDALPRGYETKVREGGNGFSSGEKQLISFARTIAHNPRILILDEATSHIDTESELLIQDSLLKIQQGRTTIAIAHRLSTIQNADLILVLEKGEIVERGNHESLLADGGRYAELIKLQQSH
jgi:ATP-binding cassette subfamily B protein